MQDHLRKQDLRLATLSQSTVDIDIQSYSELASHSTFCLQSPYFFPTRSFLLSLMANERWAAAAVGLLVVLAVMAFFVSNWDSDRKFIFVQYDLSCW
jgi:hypothetical protein